MRLVVAGVDASGTGLAHLLAEWFGDLLPQVSISVPSENAVRELFASDQGLFKADGAVLCVTPMSLADELLFFVLGAMRGSVGINGFVVPLLFDLRAADIMRTPLDMFQAAALDRSEIRDLVTEINDRSDKAVAPSVLHGAFEEGWSAFYERTLDLPGPGAFEVLVSLVLSSSVTHFRFDPGGDDARWGASIGVVLRLLPGSPLRVPDFDANELEALDVEGSRWIDVPVLLSRLQTKHIALIDATSVDQFRGEARRVARQITKTLPPKGVSDKFLRVGDKILFLRGAR